jgi:hypothetical protein
MKFDYQDKIDDYLLNRMPEKELLAFEKEVCENAELREQLEYTRSVREAITSRSEMLAAMREWENDYQWENERASVAHAVNEAPRPAKKRLVYWISGVAAVFIVGLFLLLRPTGTPSVSNLNPDVILGDSYRGGKDYSVIYDKLQQKDYEEALTYIELEADSIRMDSVEIIKDQTIDKEELEYEMILIKERQDELKWLKVLALIGLNRQEEVLSLLDELRNAECDYKQQADSFYNQINQK